MIIGNIYKFAFIIERVPEWENSSFKNGIMFVISNDNIYPSKVRTTTLNCELLDILSKDSAFINPVYDMCLYNKKSEEIFQYIINETYCDDIYGGICTYKYVIPFHEICDAGFDFFIISNKKNIKILVGKWEKDKCNLVDEVEISIEEYNTIKEKLIAFYNDGNF